MAIHGRCACGAVRFGIDGAPSALGEPLSPDATFPINAQCLDDDPGIAHSFHEFTDDAPVWERPSLPAASKETQT